MEGGLGTLDMNESNNNKNNDEKRRSMRQCWWRYTRSRVSCLHLVAFFPSALVIITYIYILQSLL